MIGNVKEVMRFSVDVQNYLYLYVLFYRHKSNVCDLTPAWKALPNKTRSHRERERGPELHKPDQKRNEYFKKNMALKNNLL